MAKKARDPASTSPQWDGVLRRAASLDIRSLDEERRSVRFVVSDETIDSHGDIVELDWQLDRYMKNPVVLWGHERWGSPSNTIVGRAEDVVVTPKALEATIVFAGPDESKVGDEAWRLVRGGFLRATSVGFRPHNVSREVDDDKEVYHLSANELMEISIVPIPSNPNSVAKSADGEGFEDVHTQERMFLRALADKQAEPTKTTSRAATPEPKQLPLLEESMTEEEKKAFEDAKVAAQVAEQRAKDVDKRAESLEKDLKAANAETKAAEARAEDAEARCKAAEERATELDEKVKASEAKHVEAEIDAMVGKKIVPAEREEYLDLAKEIGLERVKSIVAKRPDLPETKEGLNLGNEQDKPRASVTEDVIGKTSHDVVEKILSKIN